MTTTTRQGRAAGWLALLLVLVLLDVLAYAIAPRDAFDPFHPHPASWSKSPLVPRVPMRVVCWVHPAVGPATGCFHEVRR